MLLVLRQEFLGVERGEHGITKTPALLGVFLVGSAGKGHANDERLSFPNVLQQLGELTSLAPKRLVIGVRFVFLPVLQAGVDSRKRVLPHAGVDILRAGTEVNSIIGFART